MKKLVYILALALVGVACNKETVPVETAEEIVPKGKVKLVITVPAGIDSKASVSGKQITFNIDDQIAVIGTLDNETSVVTLSVESVSDNTFTFSTDIDPDMEIGDYAYYPAAIVNKDNPTRINWPSSFDGTKNQMPLMAKIDVTNNQAVFHHLGALLKVTLASAPAGVNALEFTTSNNFVGSYDVVFNDDELTSVTGYALSSNVESITATSTGTYYIPVPAGTYADFQLAMKQGTYYHKQKTASLESAITPTVGKLVNLGTFTYDVDEIEEWYTVSNMIKWDSNYNALRFIKTSANSYAFSGYAPNSGGYWYYFMNNGTQYGVQGAVSGILAANETCKRDNDEIFTSTITKSGDNWSLTDQYYSGDWYGCFKKSEHGVTFKSSIDSWGSGVSLTKPDDSADWDGQYTNDMIWYGDITVPSNDTYLFKVIIYNTGSSQDVWYGGNSSATITDATPYGSLWWDNGNDIPVVLTQGTYTFYLDIRAMNFMFVKQPYSAE